MALKTSFSVSVSKFLGKWYQSQVIEPMGVSTAAIVEVSTVRQAGREWRGRLASHCSRNVDFETRLDTELRQRQDIFPCREVGDFRSTNAIRN